MLNAAKHTVFEHECALLGAILIDNALMDTAIDRIGSLEAFTSTQTKAVWTAAFYCYEVNDPIELISIDARIKADGKTVDMSFLTGLFEIVASTASFQYYLDSVVNAAIHRRLIHWIDNAKELTTAPSTNSLKVAESLLDDLHNLYEPSIVSDKADQSLAELVTAGVERAKERKAIKDQNPHAIFGIPTGFTLVDYHTCGLELKCLSFLAARPSVGKSALAMCIGENAAKAGYPTHVFSMEMPPEQLGDRAISSGTSINNADIKRGKISAHDIYEMEHYRDQLTAQNVPLRVDGTSTLTALQLRSRMRRSVRLFGTKLFVIDYLQLISGTNTVSRSVEVGEVCKSLKDTAKDLNVHIMAVCTVSRLCEMRKGHRPMLSDLGESGKIEFAGDYIFFMHRNSYFEEKGDIAGAGASEVVEFIIAKHRNGPQGMIKIGWHPGQSRFVNLETKISDWVGSAKGFDYGEEDGYDN